MFTKEKQIASQLERVRAVMTDSLKEACIVQLIPGCGDFLGSGKMLRSRLALTLGNFNAISEKELIHSVAAVEMIHGASLLHDDVIDGSTIRRSTPSFWKKHGINGAVLFGDLLIFKAFSLLVDSGRKDLLEELINRIGEVCRSEMEQELLLRGKPGTWEACERIARYKTGSLFAFAAVAGGTNLPGLAGRLREAGYLLGTAYQLADDLLDETGSETISGKTLGTDRLRGKTTAITAAKNAPEDPSAYIYHLLEDSADCLADWPKIGRIWNEFLESVMFPLLERYFTAG